MRFGLEMVCVCKAEKARQFDVWESDLFLINKRKQMLKRKINLSGKGEKQKTYFMTQKLWRVQPSTLTNSTSINLWSYERLSPLIRGHFMLANCSPLPG